MNREDALNIILEGIVEDMRGIYDMVGISKEEQDTHIDQALESFKLISINTYDRLEKAGVITNA